MRSFSITSRTTWVLNSSEYFAAGMVSILSTQEKKNSPSPRYTTHSIQRDENSLRSHHNKFAPNPILEFGYHQAEEKCLLLLLARS